MKSTHERLASAAFGFIAGAALGGINAGVLWPWLGPSLMQPCPIPSHAGVWVYAAIIATSGFIRGGEGLKYSDTEDSEHGEPVS